MLTAPDLKALAAYLRKQSTEQTHAGRLALEFDNVARGFELAAEVEQLDHWAAGIEAEAQARALAVVDLAPRSPEKGKSAPTASS